jgi:hypothetical protein
MVAVVFPMANAHKLPRVIAQLVAGSILAIILLVTLKSVTPLHAASLSLIVKI